MNQKFIILTPLNQSRLDEALDDGWLIKQTCPMPSAVTGHSSNNVQPTCLVVLVKE